MPAPRCWPEPRPAALRSRPEVRQIGLSVLAGMVVGMSLPMAALARGDVGIVTTLSSTTPILILPMVRAIRRRVPRPLARIGAGLAVAGTALISLAPSQGIGGPIDGRRPFPNRAEGRL